MKRFNPSWLGYSLIVLGLAGTVWALYLMAPHDTTVTAPSGNQAVPSSVKPSAQEVDAYTVAPDLPKFIAIPAANVTKARIYGEGLLANGEIATTNNTNDTGWYKNSGKPGQDGTMFIFGHVSGINTGGIFKDLKKLKTGDIITITRGDNHAFAYKVVTTITYPADKVDMNAVLSAVTPSKQGLNLMTCAGKFNKSTNSFSDRYVVFASRAM